MINHHDLVFFVVQSSIYEPGNLTARYTKFLTSMMKTLPSKGLTEKKFNMIKASMLEKFKTPDQSVSGMSSTMMSMIHNYDADFEVMQEKKATIEGVQYKDVIAMAHRIFPKDMSKQRMVAVGYTPNKVKLDKMPALFSPFKLAKSEKKFVAASKYQCPVDLKKSAVAELIGEVGEPLW